MDKKLICPICGEGDPEGENFDMTKLGHIFDACRISATRISPPKKVDSWIKYKKWFNIN
jgi:hypothetical protein